MVFKIRIPINRRVGIADMAKRLINESAKIRRCQINELQKNVPNTCLQDITWTLSCIDVRVQDAVARLEDGISMVRNLTEEISKLKEFVLTLPKENGNRNSWSEIEEPATKNNDTCSENEAPATKNNDTLSEKGLCRFPWYTVQKNKDDSYLLRG